MSTLSELYSAYTEYIGCDFEHLHESALEVWVCEDCSVKIPVVASDPQGYGPVICPHCLELCEVDR